MRRWSKLQKELYLIIDPKIDFQLHCSVYRMKSQMGSTDLPRYWITLGKAIIFDYPRQFVNHDGLIDNLSVQGRDMVYPYNCGDISHISDLIRAYIDTPVGEIMTKHYEQDFWGLANILRAADRRIGLRRLETLRRRKGNIAAQKVILARQSLHDKCTDPRIKIATENSRGDMSVRKKGRRKIVHENKNYVWYVELDYDSPYHILNIISEDKQLIITCPLNMKIPYIISKGNLFQNCKSNGHWNRYSLPFDVPEIITPGFVSELISWAIKGSGAIRIEWDGKDILI